MNSTNGLNKSILNQWRLMTLLICFTFLSSGLFATSRMSGVIDRSNHSFVIKDNGSLYAVGENADGCLGTGTASTSNTYSYMISSVNITLSPNNILATGYNHSLLIKS